MHRTNSFEKDVPPQQGGSGDKKKGGFMNKMKGIERKEYSFC